MYVNNIVALCFHVCSAYPLIHFFFCEKRNRTMEQQVAGYLQMPERWFEIDSPSDRVRSFTVYRKEGTLVPHPDLRRFWMSCILPVYQNNKRGDPITQPLVHYYDTKSNPRRVHPFAVAYHEWCDKVYAGLSNPLATAPVCILKKCILPTSLFFNFREGLPDHMEPLLQYDYHDGLPALVRLQAWGRGRLAIKTAEDRRMDPEMLFRLPAKSRELYIRLAKAGIDASTYDTMCADRPG